MWSRFGCVLLATFITLAQTGTVPCDDEEPECPGANQVYNPNPGPCVPGKLDYCYEYVSGVPNGCDPGPIIIDKLEPRCECIDGYLRDDNGECVSQDECCGDPNASVVDDPYPCPDTCDTDPDNPILCSQEQKKRGCQCNPFYVIGPDGKCVLREDCPKKDPCDDDVKKCGNNEEYKEGTCDGTCINPDFKCRIKNHFACFCIEGHVRNDQKQCVPLSSCPIECGVNEVFTECLPCPPGQICPAVCRPGCICLDGYIRNDDGKCVIDEKCGENEEFTQCMPINCPPGMMCAQVCRPGCVCLKGFKRVDGKCVKDDDVGKCGENERYTMCMPVSCPPGKKCLKVCKPGCLCIDGYERVDGKCIRVDPVPECGINEEWRMDGCDGTCKNPGQKYCKRGHSFGCFCLPDHLRNDNNECIPQNTCPIDCGENEEFTECLPWYCPPKMFCPTVCVPGCICIEGYERNDNGVCVKKDKMCGINEETRMDNCDGTCDNPDLKYCDLPPSMKCFCIADHVRDANGKCVPLSECGKVCGTNEVYKEGTCDGTCSLPMPACLIANHFDCFCIEGFLRENGVCIAKEECPITCKENEEFTQCLPCPPDTLCLDVCIPGCVCKSGFERNSEGICAPIVLPVCRDDEVLNMCAGYCTFDPNCGSLLSGFLPSCPAPPPFFKCRPRCDCKPGLVRIGEACTTADKCCEGPNEIAVDCPADCDLDINGKRLSDCKCFSKGCRCMPGYVRDADGKCVKPASGELQCKESEVLNPCIQWCSFDPDCDLEFRGIVRECAPPPLDFECGPGCVCKPGLVRVGTECVEPSICCEDQFEIVVDCPADCDWDMNGVPLTDCTCFNKGCRCLPDYVRDNFKKCYKPDNIRGCKENEVLNQCPSWCSFDRDCDSEIVGLSRECPPPPDDYECQPRCDCRLGTVRVGKDCVDVSICCGMNETIADCPAPRDPTCIWNEPAPEKYCGTKSCVCSEGFIRDEQGKCVSRDTCQRLCGCNEEYKEGTCDKSCAAPNYQCRVVNHFACFCLDGYVRDENNKCIPLCDCPSCGENEEYKYCAKCPEGAVCPDLPDDCVPGCVCKDGYERNSDDVCVKKEKLKCKNGEVLVECPGYCTFDKDCLSEILGVIRDCARPPPNYQCKPTCRCEPGLVRINGDCVDINKCCKENEKAVKCPAPAEETCGNTPALKKSCLKMTCTCKDGYVRDENGDCVTRDQCAPKCKKNEELIKCPGACTFDPDCLSEIRGIRRMCMPPINYKCQPRCRCKPGFVRVDGVCDDISKCCKPTEVLVDCAAANEKTCDGNPSTYVQSCSKKTCVCKDGLFRNELYDCVPRDKCKPQECKDPFEVYKECGTCDGTCDDPFPKCLQVCRPGCFCKDNYVRRDGVCILMSACDGVVGPGGPPDDDETTDDCDDEDPGPFPCLNNDDNETTTDSDDEDPGPFPCLNNDDSMPNVEEPCDDDPAPCEDEDTPNEEEPCVEEPPSPCDD